MDLVSLGEVLLRLAVPSPGRIETVRQLDVHLQGALHILQVLRRNLGDGDVVDVDLLLADQVQQQVERPVVMFEVEIERSSHFSLGYQDPYYERLRGSHR